jgi:hypothetical protein
MGPHILSQLPQINLFRTIMGTWGCIARKASYIWFGNDGILHSKGDSGNKSRDELITKGY